MKTPLPVPPARHWSIVAKWMAALFGLSLSTAALAGPPFITDDPEPVELHAWEINYGLTYARAADERGGALPSVDINYGIYPGVQLHAQPQLAYARNQDGRNYGVGDTEIGVKYRLTDASTDKSAWILALYPMLEVPSGSAKRGLGAGAYSVYLPLWAQTTRDRWTVFGGGGYRRDSQVDAMNSWAGGVTALYHISERLQFGGEFFGETRTTQAGRGSVGFNLGGTYALDGELALLFSAGHGVKNAAATNQGAAYLGLRTAY